MVCEIRIQSQTERSPCAIVDCKPRGYKQHGYVLNWKLHEQHFNSVISPNSITKEGRSSFFLTFLPNYQPWRFFRFFFFSCCEGLSFFVYKSLFFLKAIIFRKRCSLLVAKVCLSLSNRLCFLLWKFVFWRESLFFLWELNLFFFVYESLFFRFVYFFCAGIVCVSF